MFAIVFAKVFGSLICILATIFGSSYGIAALCTYVQEKYGLLAAGTAFLFFVSLLLAAFIAALVTFLPHIA